MQSAGEKKRFRENAFSKGPPLRFSLILGHFFQIFKFPKFDKIWPDLTELDPIRLNLNNFDQNVVKQQSVHVKWCSRKLIMPLNHKTHIVIVY